MILDTNFLIALDAENPDAIATARQLEYDEPVVTRDETDFVRRLQENLELDALRVELYTSN